MKRNLVQNGSVSQAFFEGEAQAESLRADLEVLLQYIAVKAAEPATHREAMRPARAQPTALDKVNQWVRMLVR